MTHHQLIHFQPQSIHASHQRIIEILRHHYDNHNHSSGGVGGGKIILICPSGEDDLTHLNDLIQESCCSQPANHNTMNTNTPSTKNAIVSMTDRFNVSLTWNQHQHQQPSSSSTCTGEESFDDYSGSGDDHFVDGFNVWRENFAHWVDQLFSSVSPQQQNVVTLDTLLSENVELEQLFQRVMRLLLGISLVGSVTSSIRAEILSVCSEIVSRIFCLYLNRVLHMEAEFVDSSLYLTTMVEAQDATAAACALNTVPSNLDYSEAKRMELLNRIEQNVQSRIVVLQGNSVRDLMGNHRLFSFDPKFGAECTVACVAKLLECSEVSFYVSGYGLSTCQLPGVSQPIDSARVINELSFVEALEIAAASESRFISPSLLKLFQEDNISVRIKSIHFAIGKTEGTYITASDSTEEAEPQIKSVCLRTGIIMISIDTFAMWQQVGFLSDVFALFKRYNLSVDYVTTSEANVTCSLDAASEDKSDESFDRMDRINMLVRDLQSMNCRVSTIGPCASLSLVGTNIRGLIHTLSPVFQMFHTTSSHTTHPIHMISQAHSNVNLSFIVPHIEGIEVLIADVHEWIFKGDKEAGLNSAIGQEWRTLLADYNAQAAAQRPSTVTSNVVSGKDVWWRQQSSQLLELIANENQPLYVYSGETIKKRATQLVETLIRDNKSSVVNYIFFALKANPHPEILKLIESMKFGFECVSTQEMDLVLSLFPTIDRKRILFTPNFAPREDYARGIELGVNMTLDNVFAIEAWPELFTDKEIFLRIDTGMGKGHHSKVKTAGVSSKFGIPLADLDKLAMYCEQHRTTVVGLHSHVGSGILKETKAWKETAQFFLDLLMNSQSSLFQNVRTLDLGGGLGVPYRPEDQPLDISQVYHHLHSLMHGTRKYADFIQQRGLKFWIEPGRFLSADSGILLARVTQTKKKSEDMSYVGLETGMNSLIRPTLYDAYHEIVNLSGMIEQNDTETEFPTAHDNNDSVEKQKYTVVGPICETGDVFGEDRWMHKCYNGHVVVICCAGSYGHSMSSFYNNRPPAKEVFITAE